MTVMRVWRHLAQRRRSGQEHGIDEEMPFRRPNSLAIRCPACPEIGLNITKEELSSIPDNQRYAL
jgi:hypothetical protein